MRRRFCAINRGGVWYPPLPPSARLTIAVSTRILHEPSACLNPLAKRPDADRVLILRLGAVGDVVRTIPAAAREYADLTGKVTLTGVLKRIEIWNRERFQVDQTMTQSELDEIQVSVALGIDPGSRE